MNLSEHSSWIRLSRSSWLFSAEVSELLYLLIELLCSKWSCTLAFVHRFEEI